LRNIWHCWSWVLNFYFWLFLYNRCKNAYVFAKKFKKIWLFWIIYWIFWRVTYIKWYIMSFLEWFFFNLLDEILNILIFMFSIVVSFKCYTIKYRTNYLYQFQINQIPNHACVTYLCLCHALTNYYSTIMMGSNGWKALIGQISCNVNLGLEDDLY